MRVYFLGASNSETYRMMNAILKYSKDVSFDGFIDSNPEKWNTNFLGLPVLGGIEIVSKLKDDGVGFVNLITRDTRVRFETTRKIVEYGGQLVNFIHPAIDLTLVKMGVGNYIQEGVILQAEVVVGDNSSIHMGSLIGHETKIGNSVFIAHGVSVSGCCQIGDGTFIGTNATILPRVKVGNWVTIGAGAVVTKDVPDYSVLVGNPGRVIKSNEPVYSHAELF